MRRALANRNVVIALLILQIIPLLLFPPESFLASTQEWWLPVLLVLMVFVADFALLVRHSTAIWPWNLISFAQGFNIISRLMMLFPHATKTVGNATVLNAPYVALTLLAIALSAFLLWYIEWPEVRLGRTQ